MIKRIIGDGGKTVLEIMVEYNHRTGMGYSLSSIRNFVNNMKDRNILIRTRLGRHYIYIVNM